MQKAQPFLLRETANLRTIAGRGEALDKGSRSNQGVDPTFYFF